ncbi:MAG: hypothetical protein RL403_1086, partial [Bacteroidota bacterium]
QIIVGFNATRIFKGIQFLCKPWGDQKKLQTKKKE